MFNLVVRTSKLFEATLSCLGVLYNYFNGSIKLFSTLYLANFLDAAVKLFSP